MNSLELLSDRELIAELDRRFDAMLLAAQRLTRRDQEETIYHYKGRAGSIQCLGYGLENHIERDGEVDDEET